MNLSLRIPKKYQIFEYRVDMGTYEARIYKASLLSGWTTLHRALPGLTPLTIKRLIILEMMGARREMIFTRLVGRLTHVEKKRLKQQIREAIK